MERNRRSLIPPPGGLQHSASFGWTASNFDTMQKLLIPAQSATRQADQLFLPRRHLKCPNPTGPGTYVGWSARATELLTGTFRLYYDDVSRPACYSTAWTQASPRAAGQTWVPLHRHRATPKRDRYACTAEQRRHGRMKRAMFETGGVTSAQVSRPWKHALSRGLDAASKARVDETDKSGTQVLPGNEFHLRNMFRRGTDLTRKTYLSKAVQLSAAAGRIPCAQWSSAMQSSRLPRPATYSSATARAIVPRLPGAAIEFTWGELPNRGRAARAGLALLPSRTLRNVAPSTLLDG